MRTCICVSLMCAEKLSYGVMSGGESDDENCV